MKRKLALILILVLITAFLLTSCIPGDGKHTAQKPAGFFWGVWHGWIAPVSVIVGIFNKDIRVYEVNNTGWWYDFGFYIAIIAGFGGLSLFRRKRHGDE
jgi:polyferredoxin